MVNLIQTVKPRDRKNVHSCEVKNVGWDCDLASTCRKFLPVEMSVSGCSKAGFQL